jgi:hypothetical protein
MANPPSLTRLMKTSTQALHDFQESMIQKNGAASKKTADKLGVDQTRLLLKLMSSLMDTKNQLTNEKATQIISPVSPKVISAMEAAILVAMQSPIEAKVSQVYVSIFGFNSPLWQVLKEVQALLQTMEFLKAPRGKKVAKVIKKNRDRRRSGEEKDTISRIEDALER